MVLFEERQLNVTLPNSGFGIVAMQPYIDLSRDEPHCWSSDNKNDQLSRVIKTLDISKKKGHTCEKTHFTLFPEYAIPGLDGINKIQEIVEDSAWENDTVIIGGVDGLTKKEYASLCCSDRTYVHESNSVDKVGDHQWINCVITWVKNSDQNGSSIVEKWIQPKLCPAWPEEGISAHHMFEGKCVFLFQGRLEDNRAFRFLSLICYDWIAPLGSSKGIFAVLESINNQWNQEPDPKPLHIIFIPQHNKSPNHESFLKNAFDYFHDSFPFISRDRSVVLFANSAGIAYPGPCDEYGHSSLIFHSNSPYESEGSPPSYAVNTRRLRNNEGLQTCKDILFREKGQCVHSFRLFHPLFVEGIPRRQRAVFPALVHSLNDEIKDPRIPEGQVSAIIKWINDKIDQMRSFDDSLGVLKQPIENENKRIQEDLRWCPEKQLKRIMLYSASSMNNDNIDDVDLWSDTEKNSLINILTSLAYLSCVNQVSVKDSRAHGWFVKNGTVVDILIVTGESHTDNLKHILEHFVKKRERATLIISRDQSDKPLTDRDKLIFDPEAMPMHCGFHEMQSCIDSATLEEFHSKLKTVVGI